MASASRIIPNRIRVLHTFDAFHNPGYRRLWTAYLFANVSRWMQMTLLAWLVLELTDSPLRVALVGFFGMGPMLLLGMIGGVLADRVDRRRLILASQSASMIAALVMTAILFLGVERYWYAYLVILVSGIGWALDMPSRRSILPDMLGRAGLTNAVALDSVAMHASLMLGPVLAGGMISAAGVRGGYLVVGIFYLVSVLLMRSIRLPERRNRYTGRSHNILSNLVEGFRYVRGNNVILATVCVTVLMNLLLFSYVQMVPVIAKDLLKVGPGLMGVLMGAPGLGALVGAVLIASAGNLSHHGRVYLVGSMVALGALLAFSLSQQYILSLSILLVLGLGMSGFGTMQSTIVMLAASEEMRGRALGVISLAIGTGPLGALLVGVVASAASPSFAIGINAAVGAASLVTVGVLMPSLWRRTIGDETPAEGAQVSAATPRG
jgi:MFS family permease